jgi:hypothetical protein
MSNETTTTDTAPQTPAAPAPANQTAQTITAAELAGAVTMPEPSERAIETPPANSNAQTPTTAPAPKAGDRDKTGRKFDPNRHAPRLLPSGRWASKRPHGRPRKTPASFVATDPQPSAPPPAPEMPPADKYELAAELYCRTGYSLADGIFAGNGEWLPESEAEHLAIKQSVAAYLRHKQSEDLPPGWALALALAGYGAGRIAKPNTQKRIAALTGWIASKLARKQPEPTQIPTATPIPVAPQPIAEEVENIPGTERIKP